MNITFAPVDEAFIKHKVEQGYYSNITEIVRDAVRRLREQEKPQPTPEDRLRAAVQLGLDDVKAGRITAYTKDFWKKSDARIRKRLAQGKPFDFDPDVVGPEGQEPWA